MGYLAAVTERVEIASGILPIYTRTPTLLAMTAAGVDALSDGRCILGLGRLGPAGHRGLPRRALRHAARPHPGDHRHLPPGLEARAGRVRRARPTPSRSREGQGTGLGKPLKLITHPVRDRIPIYVASLGPKNVELTAEIADGWLPLFYLPEKAKDVWGDDLAAGAAKRSADLGPLEVVAGGLVAIGDGRGQGRPGLRPPDGRPLRRRHGRQGQELLQRPGLPLRLRGGGRAEIQDLYLDGKKDEAAAKCPRGPARGHHPLRPRGLREGAPRRLQGVRRDHAQHHARSATPPTSSSKLKDWTA